MSVQQNISSPILDYFLSSVGDNVYMTTPLQYLLALVRVFTDVLMDRMVLVITSFIMGMLAVVVVEIFFFWNYFIQAPVLPPTKFTASPVTLPQAMKARIDQGSIKQKEDCVWLNLLLNFLFSELRDTLALRRFLTKKIQIEFEEVLRSKSGVLVDELFLRDFHLGNKSPVITSMSVDRCDVSDDVIQTLDLKLHVVYDGGFQIGIDAALPFHRRAFVSVTVVKLKGLVRLQFSQLPFSHWNVSFYEEPELELDVTAQLDGRPMPKLRSIIANQIRKIIRRKHTLPMYKMRYKPIFQPLPQFQPPGNTHIQINGTNICNGVLEVTVIEANKLPFVVKGSKVYSTVSVDELPWKEQMLKERKKKKIITAELVKNSTDQSLGMMVMDEFLPDRLHPVVIIVEVSVGSPAHLANIQQADILVAVGESKVTSAKQAMKILKSTKDKIQIQVERSGAETHSKDELVFPRQASSWHEGQQAPDRRGQTADSHSSHTTSLTDSPKLRSKMQHKCRYQIPESRRTTLKESSTNPHWDHKFIFTVNPSMNFLNVCLWSMGGDRTGKSELISSTKQDVLIGYVSLRLEEIYLHCLLTLSGTLQDKVKLKHGHYKTEEELVKKWSVHKGWEPNEMYGQLLLSFHYVPTELSAAQRQALSGSKQSLAGLHKELSESYPTTQEGEQFKPSPTKIAEEFRRDPNEGHHQFDSTTFMTATFCDYCGKKIWMKEAFKCQTCSMVCHKKCLVKCLLNTVCTQAGAKKRSSSDEAWEPLKGTSKIRRSEVMDETVRHPGAQEEDWSSSQDMQSSKDVNIADSNEPLQNLAILLNTDQEHRAGPSYIMRKTESAPEANQGTRFRLLKEQTDRMKDNVLKHLGKSKVPATFNDKAILSAKELGAKLYSDMDPTLRKDKLEELVQKLDEELKTEMENKESLEQELMVLEEQEQKSEASKRSKSDMKVLHSKIFKSVEKQDTMRLLMLQYCSGLQNCINSLEAQAGSGGILQEVQAGSGLQASQSESSRTSRTAAVGGFVRRASSSVKEKMSFIKKDFGKRGSREDQASTSRGNNNNGLSVIEESEDVWVQDRTDEGRRDTSSKSAAEDDVQDLTTLSGVEILNKVLAMAEDAPGPSSHPTIDIQVDEVDVEQPDQSGRSIVTRDQSALTRSSSDSSLELSKMMNLRPEDILRYRGSSLPTLPASDETDSDSDFLVIDSSDEPAMTDSSDSDSNHETVAFQGKNKKKKYGRDEEDGGQHRTTAQHIHTYQV